MLWLVAVVGLVIIGMANHGVVTLRAIPQALVEPLGMSPQMDVPLFVVLFVGVGIGLLMSVVWELFRDRRKRAKANPKKPVVATQPVATPKAAAAPSKPVQTPAPSPKAEPEADVTPPPDKPE